MEKEGAAEKVVSKVKEVAEDAKDAVEGAGRRYQKHVEWRQ